MSDSKEQDGKWIYKKWCCFECSNCGFKIDQYKMHLPPDLYPYCPMCGQKNIVKLNFSEVNMNKERMEEIIKKEFGVGSSCSPLGSCTEDFLNNKIIEIAKKNNFPEDIIELFQKNPYVFPKYKTYDNGEGAGRYYINLLGSYSNP